MKKAIILLILLLIPVNLNANTHNMSITCDDVSFNEFAEFLCRISVDSTFTFDKIEFEINPSDGLSLDAIRTNHGVLWNVVTDKNKVTATTVGNQIASGFNEFAILLLQAMDSGVQLIELNNIVLTNTKEDESIEIKDTSQEIKILSSENRLKSLSVDGKKLINFNPQISSYRFSIPDKATKVDIEAVSMDDTAKMTGAGELELDDKQTEFVVPITVTSASGIPKIYVLYLEKESHVPKDNIRATLITLTDNNDMNVNFRFSPGIYEYTVELDNHIQSLEVSVEPESSISVLNGMNSRKVNIIDGDNLIIIPLRDEDGYIRNYVINATRVLSNKSSNRFLERLSVRGYSLKFNKRVKNYTLAVRPGTKELNITAIPEYDKSIVTIIGNENLTEGSIVQIMVTAENGSRLIYQITIEYRELNFLVIGLVTALVGLIGAGGYYYYKYRVEKAEELARVAAELAKAEALAREDEERKAKEAEMRKKKKSTKKKPSQKKKKTNTTKKKVTSTKTTPNRKTSSGSNNQTKKTNTKPTKKKPSNKKTSKSNKKK